MATNGSKGSKENPYSYSEYESLADAGKWKGGYVDMGNGEEPTYMMAELTVTGSSTGSSAGSGSGDFEFGSYTSFSGDPLLNGEDENDDEYGHGNKGGNGNEGNNNQGGYGNTGGGYSGGGSSNSSNSGLIYTDLFGYVCDGGSLNFNVLGRMFGTTPNLTASLINKTEELCRQLRIRFTVQEFTSAYYNQDDKRIYLSKDASTDSYIHEVFHLFQDELGILSKTNSSCNEYQAHMFNYLYSLSTDFTREYKAFLGMVDSGYVDPTYFGNDPENPFVGDVNEFIEFHEFYSTVKFGIGKTKEEGYWMLEDTVTYLESIPDETWERWVNRFIEYSTQQNYPKSYRRPYNPSYQWHWRELIQAEGFTIIDGVPPLIRREE